MLKIVILTLCFLFEPMISCAAPTVFLNILKEAAAAGQKTVVYERCIGDENHFCSKTTKDHRLIFSTKTDWQPLDEPKIKDIHGKVTFIGTERYIRVPSGELDRYGEDRGQWAQEGYVDYKYDWWAIRDHIAFDTIDNRPEYGNGPAAQDSFEPYKGKYLKRQVGDKNQYYVPVNK